MVSPYPPTYKRSPSLCVLLLPLTSSLSSRFDRQRMSLHGRSPSDTIWAGKEFDSLQHETLLRASQSPTEAHLDLAAEFIASSFRGWRITYAFIGGYALRLRGSQRRTNNVDIVIGTTVEAARRALLVSER